MDEVSIEHLKAKDDSDLLELYNHATTHGDRIMSILQGRMIDRLISSMNSNSESSNKLSSRIVWLTGIIAVATVVYAVTTILQLCYHVAK